MILTEALTIQIAKIIYCYVLPFLITVLIGGLIKLNKIRNK